MAGAPACLSLRPITAPEQMPAPARKQGNTSPQWWRPGVKGTPAAFLPLALIGEMRGVRPISPHITTSVSSNRPRSCRSSSNPLKQWSIDGNNLPLRSRKAF